MPPEGREVREKQGFGMQVPPSPTGRLPRRNYFGLSSRVQPPKGGGHSPGREIRFRGRAESLRREGQASLGSSATSAAAQTGWGQGGGDASPLGWRTARGRRQALLGGPGAGPGPSRGRGGGRGCGGSPEPCSLGPRAAAQPGAPFTPEALAPWPQGPLRLPSRAQVMDTPWAGYSHRCFPGVTSGQGGMAA